MLYALVFDLIVCNDGTLPANTGTMTHGAFLSLVRHIDPTLADRLHNNQGRQPFTLSGLFRPRKQTAKPQYVKAGETMHLRVTLLNNPLFDVVVQYFMTGGRLPKLYISEIDFEVSAIHMTNQSRPSAGHISIPELQTHWRTVERIPDKMTLKFKSPTAINQGNNPVTKQKRFWLFPEPEALWHNIRRQWGTCGGDDPGKEYDAWIHDHIEVIEYELQTHILHLGNFQQRGFTGTATFRCVDAVQSDEGRLWQTLNAFSFWSGVGYKTTMGMGQVMPYIEEQ